MKANKDRLYFIIRLVIIFIAVFIYTIVVSYPNFKKQFGSSDKYFNPDNYYDMLEVKVDKIDFAFIINNKKKITNIFFFENNSLILYNKNIEGSNIEEGIEKFVLLLKENKYLTNDIKFLINSYQGRLLQDFKDSLEKILTKEKIRFLVDGHVSNLDKKLQELGMEIDSDLATNLENLDMYSKDVIRNKETVEIVETDDKVVRGYAYNVYLKIENYIKENNISRQTIEEDQIPMVSIPADKKGEIYPSADSWYYVNDGRVYAYIKFIIGQDEYKYCYQGGIDNYKKGEC